MKMIVQVQGRKRYSKLMEILFFSGFHFVSIKLKSIFRVYGKLKLKNLRN